MTGPEPWVWRELEPLLPKSGRTAVDIGAHEGEWALALSQRFAPVWAFEPQMDLAAQLAAYVPHRVQVVPLPLASRPGLRTFTRYANSAHLSARFDNGGINTGAPRGQVELACLPLDAFALCGVEFIKIDTEGAEVEVLSGARQTIERERPILCIEVHTAENGEWLAWQLATWGYTLRALIRHPSYPAGSEMSLRHYWVIGTPQ